MVTFLKELSVEFWKLLESQSVASAMPTIMGDQQKVSLRQNEATFVVLGLKTGN